MAAVRDDEHSRTEEDRNSEKNMMTMMKKKNNKYEKSYFDVSGLCCSSEVPLIEKLLKPVDGVIQISVIVPSRTLIVVHDSLLVSQSQIVKVLNGARLEANVRVHGGTNFRQKWPSPYAVGCGLLLLLSLLKFVYHPFQWLALTAVAFGVFPMAMKGVAALRHFRLDVNILMLIAVIGTIALNDYLEAGTIVFLFSIAEWLESRASHKATAVMSSLMSIAPKRAVIAETGEEVAIEDVKINTVLAVKAGEMVPIDGVITEGKCEVDEKTLTGESFPAAKEKGSVVWAGTVNLNGYISVKTTVLGEDCVVSRMAKLVEEAQNHKSRSQRMIDRCAKYYTPAIVLLSAGLAGVPAAMQIHNKNHWFRLALVVLVSACPCALILSTPVATFCALSKAATAGLLIKGGDYLETLAKIKTVAFDKTGTITKGEFVVTDFHSFCDDVSPNTLLYWVSSIESKSSHPLAAALVDYARSHYINPIPENVEEFQIFPGEGVLGKIDGKEIYVGNKKIAERAGCETDPKLGCMINGGSTNASIYSDSACIGIFKLSDVCRSGVAEAIKELKSMGIRSSMVTGDNQAAAMQIQNQLENALDVVHAELLPEDKANIIKIFQSEGQCTAMIGDGVNDALALAMADIGVSMGISGSALATETGNVILMSNDIRKIPKAIKLARRSRRKVIENITLSISTKAAIIGLACAGHPLVWAAVLGDVGTCLLVIFNSMLLLRGTHHHRENCSRFSSHHHSPHNNHSHYCSKPSIQQTPMRQQNPCESKCCESLSKHSSSKHSNCCSKPSIQQTPIRQHIPCERKCCESLSKHSPNKHSNCCSKPSIQQTPIRQQIPCERKCCESLSKHSSNKHSNCCSEPSVGQQLTTTKICASQCCSSPHESECCKPPLSKHAFHSHSNCSSDPVLGRQQTMTQIYASQCNQSPCKSKSCGNLNQHSSHSQSHCIPDTGVAQQSTMAQICASQYCPSPCKNKCTESLGMQLNRCMEGNDVQEAHICDNEGFHQTGCDHGPHSEENSSDCKVHAHSKDSWSHNHSLGAASGLNSIVASTAAVHGCMGMEIREVDCKSCREECRGREGYKVEANFGVPLTEIITE